MINAVRTLALTGALPDHDRPTGRGPISEL